MDERDDLIGQTIAGRYRVTSKIGAGGMGAVYAAVQENLSREVAVKVILASLARDPLVITRFEREAQLVARLSHPNIVTVHDFGRLDDGALYIVMERLQGTALSKLLRVHGRMPWPTTLRIVRDVTSAVAAAHKAGVIHRDLKPDNVMLVDAEGRPDFVKVLDFGVAKQTDRHDLESARLTGSGMIVGTPGYMAPEVLFAGTSADARADLYAIGLIWLEMLLGRPVYAGGTPASVLVRQATEPPPMLDVTAPDAGVPAHVQRLIYRLVEKDPDKRTPDAATLLADLDAILQLTASGAFALPREPAGPWLSSTGGQESVFASSGGTLPYGSLDGGSRATGVVALPSYAQTSVEGSVVKSAPSAVAPVTAQPVPRVVSMPGVPPPQPTMPGMTTGEHRAASSRGMMLGVVGAIVVAFVAGMMLQGKDEAMPAVAAMPTTTTASAMPANPLPPAATTTTNAAVVEPAVPAAAPSGDTPSGEPTGDAPVDGPDGAAEIADEADDEDPRAKPDPKKKKALAQKKRPAPKKEATETVAVDSSTTNDAPPPAKGALTSAKVKAAIAKSLGKAASCTNTNIKNAPTGPGLLVDHCPSYQSLGESHSLVLTVGPDGKVAGARFRDEAAASSKIGRCVQESVKQWTFPEFDGDAPVEISQRVVFEACVPINGKCVF